VEQLSSALSFIRPQEKVAFIAKTHPSTLFLFLALFRLQAIACPLSTRLPPQQIPQSIQRLQADHFLDVETLSFSQQTKRIETIRGSQLATFLFTSGSIGTPKIACHTFGNHYANAEGMLKPLDLSHDSSYLLSLPLFHVGGIAILFRSLLAGATLVLSPSYPATHLSFVPTQLFRKKDFPPPPSLKCALIGGAPFPSSIHLPNWPLFHAYGMTEMSSTITVHGKAVANREVTLKNQEIYVRGKTLFAGYFEEGKITLPLEEGWFATKDIGHLSEDGKLIILGRKDRQFISGGENIQPEEIENALLSIPGITRAKVTPVEDLEFGYRPVAFIESSNYTLNWIKEQLSPLLPSFKHPTAVHPFCDSLCEK
jgi:O-succinylbenzoic acid--CoA ligase